MKALIRFTAAVIACVSSIGVSAEVGQRLSEVVIYPERSAPATVVSLNDSMLSAQIEARIIEVPARVSQTVKRGDVLVKLECADYRLNYESAQAAVVAAQSQLALANLQQQRADSLLEKKLLSQQQWDARSHDVANAEAGVKQTEVSVKQAALRVGRCSIKAPFDGVVTQRLVSVGQLAAIGTPAIQLVDISRLEVSAHVPYSEAALLTKAMRFWVDYGQKAYVDLLNKSAVIDSTTRSQELRFTLAKDETAPAGAAGKLVWRDPRPFIPAKYIVDRNGDRGVFINDGGTASFVVLDDAAPGRDTPTTLSLETVILTESLTDINAGDTL